MKALHDVHLHNFLSGCSDDMEATVDSYIAIAKAQGLGLIGFANHAWDASVPLPGGKSWARDAYTKPSVFSFAMQIVPQLPKEDCGIRVLLGMETEYCGMFDVLGMGKEAALQLDYLLIPHSHCHMSDFVMAPPKNERAEAAQKRLAERFGAIDGISPERARALAASLPPEELEHFMGDEKNSVNVPAYLAEFMVDSFRSLMHNETLKGYSDLIPVSVAHPFQAVGYKPHQTAAQALIADSVYGELFTLAARRGIGLEINPDTNNEEAFRMYGIARECGCRFTLGSDAHTRRQMSLIQKTQPLIDRLSLTEDDLMDFVRT